MEHKEWGNLNPAFCSCLILQVLLYELLLINMCATSPFQFVL